MTDLCEHLDAVRELARAAGRSILDVYERGFEVTEKADGSPLTQADRAAHEVIAAGLKQLTPDIPLLSEESAAATHEIRASWECFWLVDPLDGTKEFVSRNGEFTVNIAFIERGRQRSVWCTCRCSGRPTTLAAGMARSSIAAASHRA